MAIRAPRRRGQHNRLPPNFIPPILPIASSQVINAGKLRITCTAPLVITGIPLGIECQGAAPTAIDIIANNIFDLTYAAPPVATNVVRVRANISQIRGKNGAYLSGANKILT